ncbi:hypothetical protein ALC62_04479, partial [Cyphomyrmex costatus]
VKQSKSNIFSTMDKKEFRAVIKYYFLKGKISTQIQAELQKVHIYSFITISEFKRGRTNTDDKPPSGRPKTATNEEMVNSMGARRYEGKIKTGNIYTGNLIRGCWEDKQRLGWNDMYGLERENGNISPILKIGSNSIIVKNTCGLDSIVQIMAAACVYEKFKETVDTATTDAFKFIKSFVQLGPSKKIYKIRAELLKSVTSFIQDTAIPNTVTIDALSNVINVCEYVFQECNSYVKILTCEICGNIKIVKKYILPINEEMLNKTDYAKIVDVRLLLAKKRSSEAVQGEIVVPLWDFRNLFRQSMWDNTQPTIVQDARLVDSFYFENYYNPLSNKPWFAEFNEDRAFVTFVNRLRSSHYNLNELLARKGYVDSARCDCGYEVKDVDHVIWRCSRYDEASFRLDFKLRSRGILDKNSIFTWIKRGR